MFGPQKKGLLAQQQPRQQGLLTNPMLYAGLGLLSNQNGAQGVMQGLGMHQQIQQAQAQQAAVQQQMAQRKKDHELREKALQAQIAKASQGPQPTANMRDFEHRQGLDENQRAQYDAQFARQQNTPATIQEYRLIENMSPEERELWFSNKRAAQFQDVGGVSNRYDPISGALDPLTTIEEVAGNEAQVSQSKAHAGAIGTAVGDAEVALAGSGIEVEATAKFIDDLRNHPGKDRATGKSSMFNGLLLAGTDGSDFLQKLETAKGKAFASAYETLKGGGTITEVETNMATKALANLNVAQSEQQFNAALDMLELAIRRGHEKLKAKAALGGQQPSPKVVTGDQETGEAPQVGMVVDGYAFMGGDPSDPASWKRTQ